MASIGIPPSVPPGPFGMTAGVAPALASGNAGAPWLIAGAAEAQLWGTERMPTEAARPAPAVTTALPMLGAATRPVPEPAPLPKTLVTGLIDCMNTPAEPNIDMPDVSAVDDDVKVVNDDSGEVDDIDEAVELSPALGVAAATGVDIAVVSGDTV